MSERAPLHEQHDMTHEERLGLRLREAREYLGLTQEFVAEQLDVPRASISAIETGKRKVSSRELAEFARLYKRPIAQLLGTEDDNEPTQDDTVGALFRTTRQLTEEDRRQVLKFAQFLRSAGRPPTPDR